MDDTIYYDENLFYLNEVINTIADGLRLDLESSIFVDKIVDDVLFTEHALAALHDSLMHNELLVHRVEHLRRLMRTKRRFADVLSSTGSNGHGLETKLLPFAAKFRDIASSQRNHVQTLQDLVAHADPGEEHPVDVVSEQEFRFLLDEENSEEPA